MIRLELADKTILKFNLKTYKREKALRSAWYAMYDIPKCGDKELTMITDQGTTHKYKVSDIKSCEFTEKKFDYKTPTKIAPTAKKWENAVIPKAPIDAQIDEVIEIVYEFLKKLFNGATEEIKTSANKFIEALKQNNIPLDPNDDFLRKCILEVMQAPEERLPFFVSLYIQYYQTNKK